jgi:1-aminocyclopropane-1-carboxylate deaminase
MTNLAFDKISVDPITFPATPASKLSVLRLDKIHPLVSGNKWYKLKYYIQEAKGKKLRGILTFGGAFSNHLLATAAICRLEGLHSIGIVRGEKPPVLSNTLINAIEQGMDLHFISREDYRNKLIPPGIDPGEHLLVPEGGYGKMGARGAAHIIDEINDEYSHICCAVGTGTMMAGLINSAGHGTHVTGISVLKNNFSVKDEISNLVLNKSSSWDINHDYHFGGYAKHPPELISFMNEFYGHSNIPSDIVYTGKLFYGVMDLAAKNFFPSHSRILLIHSGGLQGNNSLEKGTLIY